MNIYVYNSSTINEYSQDDSGFLTDSSWEVIDCGNILEDAESNEDFYDITCNETITPFGGVRVGGKTKYKRINSIFKRYLDLNSRSIIFNGIVLRWIGFSVLFQLSNDMKREVIPDVSGGGIS